MINRSALGSKNPGVKPKLNHKFTNVTAIANAYSGGNPSIRESLLAIDKRPMNSKNSRKLRKKITAIAGKKRDYKLIDLTLNHHEEDSDLNFTTTEGSLPPLDRGSNLDSECDEETKLHERYSRSHERVRDSQVLQGKNHASKRYTQHEKKASKNNSIVISDNLISLANGDAANMRSNKLAIHKELSFDNHKMTNCSETKKTLNNASLSGSAIKGSLNKDKLSQIKQNMQLKMFSKSEKRAGADEQDSRPNSRKNRLMSGSSSRSKINLEEFSKIKNKNEQFKGALTDMLAKFSDFTKKMSMCSKLNQNVKSSESGSSIVWKDTSIPNKYGFNNATNAEPDMIEIEVLDEKDQRIKELQQILEQKDKLIAQLKNELGYSTIN
mmetsp:Transcript_17757/g.20523  ORF Transcript_17757/g.20523 Transcript_17757/m.20523 type:complete len:382 (-) Transcript_17757:8-1153(-)